VLNWLLRYQPAIQILDELGAHTVLDVGAGWHGVTRWWPHAAVQTDIDFGRAPRNIQRRGIPSLVRASAEALPFADGAFDFALSLDMIEHLPAEIRAESIRELTRVARRGVVVGFPVGARARKLDESLARVVRTLRQPLPDWLEEHLAQQNYPDRSTLLEALPSTWAISRELPVGNVSLQRAVVLSDMTPGLSAIAGAVERKLARNGKAPAFLNHGDTYRTIWLLQPKTV
jgi:hypothetical protein